MINSIKINYSYFKNTFFLFLICNYLCFAQVRLKTGAENISEYLNLIRNKNVGLVANNGSIINNGKDNIHLVDSLISLGVKIKKVFAPEHGFRGNYDAGEKVYDQIDKKTKIEIISLYGKNKKPKPVDLKNIEILIFDLQDVGVRFFTYISTLHYVMEACAENNISLIVLDRPNPNSHYIDGPVLNPINRSFVGMHEVPIVYGMTIGEYAKMINGEGWLTNSIKCKLKVIPLKNYTHKLNYIPPLRPSPNLPNKKAIELYPSLCLLEPTVISVGRGTEMQFQIYGNPNFPKSKFKFIPKPNFGAKNPKHNGVICYGEDLRKIKKVNKINLKWLIDSYNKFPDKKNFFLEGFDRISGDSSLKKQIVDGWNEKKIRKTWNEKLEKFKIIRNKYLIYP